MSRNQLSIPARAHSVTRDWYE